MTITALSQLLAAASFLAFVVFGFIGFRPRRELPKSSTTQLQAAESAVIEAVGKLTENFAKLAESFAKAGPAISALVASIIYMLIALAAAGK
jgi:hypothetical protein